jgi:hypothetical protein
VGDGESAFLGSLSPNLQKELWLKCRRKLGKSSGNLISYQAIVCADAAGFGAVTQVYQHRKYRRSSSTSIGSREVNEKGGGINDGSTTNGQ